MQCDLWIGWEQPHTVCSSSRLNQCGHVVVSWFLAILSAHAKAILEQVHMKMLWFGRPPPPLLSFFFSLESLWYPVSFVCAAGKLSGITSTAHLPRSRSKLETVFLDFELPHAASESLLKHSFCSELKVNLIVSQWALSDSQMTLSNLQTRKPNSQLWWPVLLERAIKIVYPVKTSASVYPGWKTRWN